MGIKLYSLGEPDKFPPKKKEEHLYTPGEPDSFEPNTPKDFVSIFTERLDPPGLPDKFPENGATAKKPDRFASKTKPNTSNGKLYTPGVPDKFEGSEMFPVKDSFDKDDEPDRFTEADLKKIDVPVEPEMFEFYQALKAEGLINAASTS